MTAPKLRMDEWEKAWDKGWKKTWHTLEGDHTFAHTHTHTLGCDVPAGLAGSCPTSLVWRLSSSMLAGQEMEMT